MGGVIRFRSKIFCVGVGIKIATDHDSLRPSICVIKTFTRHSLDRSVLVISVEVHQGN